MASMFPCALFHMMRDSCNVWDQMPWLRMDGWNDGLEGAVERHQNKM